MNLFSTVLSASGGTLWENIAAWYENSVFCELLTYLQERYFTVRFEAYENISLEAGAGDTARSVILMAALGIIIAAGMTVYTRNHLGKLVRKMLKQELTSPERAQTLYQLGYFRSASIRRELSRGVNLRRVVRCCEEEAFLASVEEKRQAYEAGKHGKPFVAPKFVMDFTTARFYIPEELKYRAENRYRTKGSGWGLFFGIVAIAVVVSALLCYLLPDLFRFADNLISMLAP